MTREIWRWFKYWIITVLTYWVFWCATMYVCDTAHVMKSRRPTLGTLWVWVIRGKLQWCARTPSYLPPCCSSAALFYCKLKEVTQSTVLKPKSVPAFPSLKLDRKFLVMLDFPFGCQSPVLTFSHPKTPRHSQKVVLVRSLTSLDLFPDKKHFTKSVKLSSRKSSSVL